MIIDFHVHSFPPEIAPNVLYKLGVEKARILPFSDGTMDGIIKSMEPCGINYSVNLPVPTSMKQVIKLNRLAIETKEEHFAKGIINFGGMHPDYEDYKTIIKDLAANGIQGIKVHPSYMGIDIDDIRFLRILDAASEAGLAIITHAGIDIGIYDRNYCSVKHVLNVIEQVHPETFILAHMGNWGCWDEVEKYLCGAPVLFDTAFSLGKTTPNPLSTEPPYMDQKLTEEEFVRICKKHGTDKILFGTDSPWGDAPVEVEQIKALPFSDEEKEMIFSGNARKILKI
ncbi:MAG: amidohydrolase family protein [Eubacteriales bacterium]|nr:amidohydrolase family protein [Eubacteriales bacterium]